MRSDARAREEEIMRKRMTVEDLMSTAVIALRANDTVGRVREEMELAEIRHIPVIDDRNHVIGIVSNRDLHRAAKAQAPRRVADVMTRDVRTVRPSTPAAEAAAILIELKIGSLPVVGDEEQLIGVITETDFLAVAQQALSGLPLDSARA
jgi:CBS domain-containing protein